MVNFRLNETNRPITSLSLKSVVLSSWNRNINQAPWFWHPLFLIVLASLFSPFSVAKHTKDQKEIVKFLPQISFYCLYLPSQQEWAFKMYYVTWGSFVVFFSFLCLCRVDNSINKSPSGVLEELCDNGEGQANWFISLEKRFTQI